MESWKPSFDKRDRRYLFHVAQVEAEEIKKIKATTRERGAKTPKNTLSASESGARTAGIQSVFERIHPVLTVVTLHLLHPEVERQIEEEANPVEIPPLDIPQVITMHAQSLTILATGLDKIARGTWDEKQIWATPNDTPSIVTRRYFTSNQGLEETRVYKELLHMQITQS